MARRNRRHAVTGVLDKESVCRLLSVMACLILAAPVAHATGDLAGDPSVREHKEQKTRDFLLRLHSLETAKSDDLEVQLGLAVFYGSYVNSVDFEKRDAQYARVLQIDPNNRVIWQMRARNVAGEALGTQRRTVHDLESLIENAQKYGRPGIDIWTGIYGNDPDPNRPWRVLYNVFGDKTGKSVEIEEKDYDQARAKVRQYADEALNQGIKAVDECERHDPENAFHDYLKAELYFNLRQPALAVQELRAAVRKPFLQAYVEQKEKAVAKALDAADAPPGLFSTTEHRSSATGYVFPFIWQQYVDPLVEKMEKDGDLGQAQEIQRLVMGLARQIREEPLPEASDYHRRLADRLEQLSAERIAALEKRKGERKPSDNPPSKD